MASRYQFSKEEISAIEQARKENKDKRAEARLKALELRAKGASAEGAAAAAGFHAAYISQLVAKYRDNGLEAISGNHYGGNRRNMSIEKEAAILAPFKERAEKGELVEIGEIAKAYQAAVDHPVSNGQIYFILHRHGWRKVMPRSKHPKKASPEMNPIEQIWKEIRKRGFRNEVFTTLEKVVDRLCDVICSLSNETISSITGRDWIIKAFN